MPNPNPYTVFKLKHRYYIGAGLAALVGLAMILILPLIAGPEPQRNKQPIKVGILHSLSGTMALSERPVSQATLYAIEELNRNGGLLGRKIEPIVVDGRSDWDRFAREAERLITKENVSAVFGCWTSACRKTVKPVFEKYDHVLFYPVQYEGLETSPNIIYTGAAPNQQIIPATKWSLDNLGKRVFLVGSDYVFPRTANAIIRAQVSALNGEVVGEAYRLLGSDDFTAVIERIKTTRPDVVINTINGDSNVAFYRQLRAAGIQSSDIPVMSFSMAEAEVRVIGADLVAGDYAARNYFQSLETPENKAFLTALRQRFGPELVATAPMEAAYFGVRMWARAVEEAGSDRYADYRNSLLGQSMKAPSGVVFIDPATRHTWRRVLIGRATPDAEFEQVWSSNRPVRPIPYPGFRSVSEWEAFLSDLNAGWGGRWAAGETP